MADLREQLQSALADRYRVERELGRGGMATVYLAHDLRHDRPVALKVLHPDLAATLGPERFQREIKLAARLQHPHILTVHDSGETAGQLWYTMPYVEGESLRARLQRETQLPVDEAVRITREAAQALQYAHDHGAIHRDIKPDNLLLTREGHTFLADFGIGRPLDQVAAGAPITATGVVVGTPAYIAPEQASGQRELDGRADVYSLGVVLYELLAGEPPFTGPTTQAILTRRFTETPRPLHLVRETVPETVERAVMKALARTPADRFQTAAEFARALVTPEITTPPPATAPSSTVVRHRGRRSVGPAIAVAILVLASTGLYLWQGKRHRAQVPEAGPKRLAVLPFENRGDSADAYFADGVTDEVRGKLATLPGLAVIARTSSMQYKGSSRDPRQIGRELDVQYLLTGTVRWDKHGQVSRVRVNPELVEVSTATTQWQQPFEAPLTDVFQVQGQIAGRVAGALGVALGAGERERFSERPTQNLAAYDAFLRGEEAGGGNTTLDPVANRRARDYYEQAVGLDSSFALAWAQLSRAYSLLYLSAPNHAAAAAARRAAERSLALAPKRPDGHLALGNYYEWVRHDAPRALEQYTRGRQLAPRDARLLAWAGWAEFLLGRVEEGLADMREAEVLDPRSVDIANSLTWPLLSSRRYAEALATAERARALAPSNLLVIVTVVSAHLAQGDLVGARGILGAVPAEVAPAALVAQIATADLYWVLDDAQQRLLLRISPESFGGDRAAWGLALAETHALRGDSARARAYADSARLTYEARLRDVPEDAPTHTYLGLALGYGGRRTEAIREGERGVALLPISRNAGLGTDLQRVLAWTYLLVGEPERALDQLEPLLKIPYYLSPGWLKIDPNFAPLRGNPRFERLVNGK